MSETKTLFDIKYAMTGGIVSGQYVEASSDGYWRKEPHDSFSGVRRMGGDVFETRDEAIKAARAMRDKKIASLKKQIAKLEKLEF